MMSIDELMRVNEECEQFLHASNKLIEELANSGQEYVTVGSYTSGACRRQSMELSRALTDLRRSG